MQAEVRVMLVAVARQWQEPTGGPNDARRCMLCGGASNSQIQLLRHTRTCPLSVLARALEGGEDG